MAMLTLRSRGENRGTSHRPQFLSRSTSQLLGRLFLVVIAFCTSACGNREAPSSQAAEEVEAAPSLEVLQPSAHLMPNMGAVYMTIVNSGTVADRLVRIESPLAAGAETHETLEQDGVMRMVPRPEGFEIPAGGRVTLEPSGKHIMLLEPSPAEEGATTLAVTLYFETSGPLEVEARLRALTE